jgi:hypothetical protein
MSIIWRKLCVLLCTLFAVAFILSPSSVTKADTITISPPSFEMFGNPGDTIVEKLKVTNQDANDATYQSNVEDFTASGEEGGINLVEDPNAPRSTFSLAKWITLEPNQFTVPAKQSRTVSITVHIPKTAEPGGHYASIQVRIAGSPSTQGGASVQSNLNTLILLRVSGDLNEKLALTSFNTDSNYYQSGPVTFNLRSENQGNVHLAPTGTIVITDMFNRKVKEIPLKRANVLPGTIRSTKTVWDDVGSIGRFTATLVADYGSSQKKQVLTASSTFIVLPRILIYVVLGLIVGLILILKNMKLVKKLIHQVTSD